VVKDRIKILRLPQVSATLSANRDEYGREMSESQILTYQQTLILAITINNPTRDAGPICMGGGSSRTGFISQPRVFAHKNVLEC
jgi:hypothetical protein